SQGNGGNQVHGNRTSAVKYRISTAREIPETREERLCFAVKEWARIDQGSAASCEGMSIAGSSCDLVFDEENLNILIAIINEAAALIAVIASVSAVGGGGVL